MPTTNLTPDQATHVALELFNAGRLADAEYLCRQILAASPDHPMATHVLGVVVQKLGRNDEGIALLRRSLELSPTADFYNNLGEILRTVGQLDEAIEALQKSIELRPDESAQQNNLGLAYLDKKELTQAEAHLRRAVQLNDRYADGHSNLAVALLEQSRYEEAEKSLHRALSLDPNNATAHLNMANVTSATGRLAQADFHSLKAVTLRPDHAQSHLVRCAVLMFLGRLPEGWEEYEWRTARMPTRPAAVQTPAWDGRPLDGKMILLHSEQGFGDTLQFVRYAPMVAERGGRAIVMCQNELVEVVKSVPGVAEVIGPSPLFPAFDAHCPLLSLPRVFRTDMESIPADVPYLKANPLLVARWKERADAASAKLRIGIAWAGNPTHERDLQRSCNLGDLAPLASVQDAAFFSLQKGDRAKQADNPPAGMNLINVAADLNDFSETAALIANLDLVITVDTAAAHLAGALGKPVWLLLAWRPEWRWFRDRTDSPWYPTMQIFRQPKPGDWPCVARQVANLLKSQSPPPIA